jgi:hypothetical protein
MVVFFSLSIVATGFFSSFNAFLSFLFSLEFILLKFLVFTIHRILLYYSSES